ncbi:phage head-tail joining protein [Paracoccus marinaquae]|uniref:TubC N-terminal docking domain-containing protein n=1 Tax=Paracoccus marinaquae TaxID=2841926 RepID=A0ABS6APS7_9RHOB|nr:hypothetical protein [Paracoccus marinaquae]MBU3031867.1 hypothetical protein [Paracoccus marinaquae]
MEIDRMRALLSALQEARFSGLRAVSYDGKTLTYGSDTELAAAISDLEARIARAAGKTRRRHWGTVATKGL